MSPPTGWLTGVDSSVELPPESPVLEQSTPPTRALPAARPTAVPPGIQPAPPALMAPSAPLPLQTSQPPLWPAAAGRVTHRTIAPRAVGEVSHDFGGHMLGFSTMATAIGAIVGTRYGGMYGGAAGGLAGGSVVNLYRAARFAMLGTDEGDREAIVSGTYALVTAVLGGVVLYKLDRRRTATPNPKTCRNAPRSCGFRKTGL